MLYTCTVWLRTITTVSFLFLSLSLSPPTVLSPFGTDTVQNVKKRVVAMEGKVRSYPSKKSLKIKKLQIMAKGVAQGEDIFCFTAHY